MNRRRRSNGLRRISKQTRKRVGWQNKSNLVELLHWVLPEGELFSKEEFHGNSRWSPEQLAAQALVWSWQETKYVTDAFDHAREVCEELGWKKTARTYTAFMNALDRYDDVWMVRLRKRYQALAEQIGGRFFRSGSWVLIGFDGSRATTPRTASNERAFCAPNYGHGKRAKVREEKVQGPQAEAKQGTSTTRSGASSLDHHDVAHGVAAAVDVAAWAFPCQRTRSRQSPARRGNLPRKHAVLRRCGLRWLSLVERPPQGRRRLCCACGC